MGHAQAAEEPEEPKPDTERIERLLDSANSAGIAARNTWLGFLLILAYLFVAVSATTHIDLLLDKPVTLPVVGIAMPLTGFYGFGPPLLFVAHLGILTQHLVAARILHRLNDALIPVENAGPAGRTYANDVRARVAAYVFCQRISGPTEPPYTDRRIMGVMVWGTLVFGPPLALTAFLVQFLPYHDMSYVIDDPSGLVYRVLVGSAQESSGAYSMLGLTWQHRLWLVADIIVPLFLLPKVFKEMHPAHRRKVRVGRFVRRMTVQSIVKSGYIAILLFAFFVATIPGEVMEAVVVSSVRDLGLVRSEKVKAAGPSRDVFVLTSILFGSDSSIVPGLRFLRRNIEIVDDDITEERNSWDGVWSHRLRSRDLRFAVLKGTDMKHVLLAGAILDGADLSGTDLRGSDLTRAQLGHANLSGANLEGADLTGANLADADLVAAQLRGASFWFTNLEGADLGGAHLKEAILQQAYLSGADLSEADLERARLTHTLLTGARLLGATLDGATMISVVATGADFTGARLRGASLKKTTLRSADLTSADLRGADLAGAVLDDATLFETRLEGALLRNASLIGARFRNTGLDGALLDRDAALELPVPPAMPASRIGKALAEHACADGTGHIARGLVHQSLVCSGPHCILSTQREQEVWISFNQTFVPKKHSHCPGFFAIEEKRLATLREVLPLPSIPWRWKRTGDGPKSVDVQ